MNYKFIGDVKIGMFQIDILLVKNYKKYSSLDILNFFEYCVYPLHFCILKFRSNE